MDKVVFFRLLFRMDETARIGPEGFKTQDPMGIESNRRRPMDGGRRCPNIVETDAIAIAAGMARLTTDGSRSPRLRLHLRGRKAMNAPLSHAETRPTKVPIPSRMIRVSSVDADANAHINGRLDTALVISSLRSTLKTMVKKVPNIEER